MKYVDAVTDISIADIKVDLMRTAYDNDRALLNTFDPRVVLVWSVLFMIVPWLFYDPLPLAILLGAAFVLAALSQVSKYLLALLLFGQITNIGFFVVMVPAMGGAIQAAGYLGDNTGRVTEAIATLDPAVFGEVWSIVATATGRGIRTATTSQSVGIDAVGAVVPFFLKLTIISVISLAVFSAMSPQKLSKGMLRLGVPRQLTFAIAYGYRMMPLLVEEYHALVNSFRLRSEVPEKTGFLKWRYFYYLLKLSVKAFYPLIFNVAKRARVTVEAMETKGFSRSLGDERSRALRTEGMMVRTRDVSFVFGSLLFIAAVWAFT
ncbi:energy-coupling factor transporter transmembrane protein EcfT [Halosimplex litoreum]|uniref:Energy-coupling factor transporter transmembrane protein EcfT n=1 Tax=Halosimplex litoreum TaxID=1198301 RepID=A0A7U3WAR1_9EURY|nr:energy-coupling factor transporter transmembrane component T [Halosimplex litoreum]QPV64706.1 energy-coupling factor transporter transmembrane protein EcfT [Halosimplex litoreum]